MGYEDLNDHAFLRRAPLRAAARDKLDPLGRDRFHPAFRGAALAAPCTLNRLELSHNKAPRGHQLSRDPGALETCLLTMGARCLPQPARAVGLELDARGHRLHGAPAGRPFSGDDDGSG